MSDYWFNLRIIFWHIQITTYGHWRFSFNSWVWMNKRALAFARPIVLYDFDWSRRNSEKLESVKVISND